MVPPGAAVRAARPADLAAVAGIHAHYVRHTVVTFAEKPRTEAEWEQLLAEVTGSGLPFLVAELAGAVVGFAYAAPWRAKPAYRFTVEDSVFLAPEATGRGLGTALLGTLVAEAGRAGRRQMIAVVADTGEGASAALHRRLGFAEVGRLTDVGHKHGRWIDTLLLQRALPAPDPDPE
ncbi:GNAT family N-acetyltransferase [Streptomyces sp. DSM 44915]|uniref:GNAT family N-acetyltransferase n=1 Tax=Streptomyces chisholmiae TaxID=3075540 RepID=A0ABU2JNE0_9ACTN|nr:N-acetyltransferase family protein [Streptomyces sp. DSM 44915]MDT0266515.1 GNAT family N-acetyltransferase [Streptomyces sp. DSM 44915]